MTTSDSPAITELCSVIEKTQDTNAEKSLDWNAIVESAAAYEKSQFPAGGEEIETVIGDFTNDLRHLTDALRGFASKDIDQPIVIRDADQADEHLSGTSSSENVTVVYPAPHIEGMSLLHEPIPEVLTHMAAKNGKSWNNANRALAALDALRSGWADENAVTRHACTHTLIGLLAVLCHITESNSEALHITRRHYDAEIRGEF